MCGDFWLKESLKVLEEVADQYPKGGPAVFKAMREGLRRAWDEKGAKGNEVHVSTKDSTWSKPDL